MDNSSETKSDGRSRRDFRISRGPNKNISRSTPEPSGRTHDTRLRDAEVYSSSSSENAASDSSLHSSVPATSRVRYMNGDVLSRPLKLPKDKRLPAIAIICVAVILGAIFLWFYYDDVVNRPIREQQQIEENLSKQMDLDLPDLITLIPLDDQAIMATLEASGGTYYERSADNANSSVFEVIKLPEGVSLADAAMMYLTGINKLNGTQASLLLNGSWDLDVDRSKGMNMSIHYADFHSGTVESAINNAMTASGLDQTQLAESGEDNSGNTYSSGNVTVGESAYAWRISAIPLSEVYSISGLPEDAVYVGIRITS